MGILSILPSLVGLFVAFAVLFATIRVQDFVRRVDELCDNIRDAAELGVDYWLSNSVKPEETVAMEARIVGRQQFVVHALDSLGSHFRETRRSEWNDSLAPFVDALTGGEFGESDREWRPERAKLVQAEMAQVIATIRKLQATSLRIPSIFRILI